MSSGRLDEEILVLGRFYDQSIIINGGTPDEIKITVVDLPPGVKVKLGFIAPKSVEVHREEIYQRLRQQEDQSGSASESI